MTAIIVEDEQIAYRRLKRLVEDNLGDEIEILKHFDSVKDTADYLLNNDQPDILFLDIHLNDGISLELFDIVDVTSGVIFTTAFDQYAIDAFRKSAIDYLLKPIKKEELQAAVEKASFMKRDKVRAAQREILPYRERFLIRFGTRLHSVKTSDIAYIYSENKLSFFILWDGKKIPSDFKIQDLEESLDPDNFFRANRQFLIHVDSISEMVAHTKSRIRLILEPPYNGEIVVSTETTRRFKEWLSR